MNFKSRCIQPLKTYLNCNLTFINSIEDYSREIYDVSKRTKNCKKANKARVMYTQNREPRSRVNFNVGEIVVQ